MINCPICKSKSETKFISNLNRTIIQCGNIKCSHLFIEDFANDSGICEELDRGSDLSFDKLKKDKKKRIDTYNIRNQLIFKSVFEKLNLKQDARVLDFGSGDGALVFSLKSVFPEVHVTCIEPHDIFSELLKETADRVVDSVSELSETFDLIILNEVIEHLNYPVEELQSLSPLLKSENAGIFLATPLGETHVQSNATGAYATYSHLHFFTRKSLNYCLNLSGLTSLDTADINYPIYSTNLEKTFKGRIKKYLINFIVKRIFKFNMKYCMLPSGHISGLTYKK